MTRLWKYAWKQSDGVRHEATIEASSKEEVFSTLRRDGIRPIKVDQILRTRDKIFKFARSIGIIFFASFTAGVSAYMVGRRTTPKHSINTDTGDITSSCPRKQIDISQIALADVFAYKSERYLALFASPGVIVSDAGRIPQDIEYALESPIRVSPSDPVAVAELKRIVSGIKQEIILLRESGKDFKDISEWLILRQQMESEFRRQLIAGREKDVKSRKTLNEKLRAMGLAEVH